MIFLVSTIYPLTCNHGSQKGDFAIIREFSCFRIPMNLRQFSLDYVNSDGDEYQQRQMQIETIFRQEAPNLFRYYERRRD